MQILINHVHIYQYTFILIFFTIFFRRFSITITTFLTSCDNVSIVLSTDFLTDFVYTLSTINTILLLDKVDIAVIFVNSFNS